MIRLISLYYSVSHGCTLQLVLAMRGGPISTRRVVLEDPSLQEVIDYVEANGDDMWNDLPITDNTQVTVLLFRLSLADFIVVIMLDRNVNNVSFINITIRT